MIIDGNPRLWPLERFPKHSLCICLRDPITRYFSGWRSRYEKGFPDHFAPEKGWKFGLGELIFQHYNTPQAYFQAVMQGQAKLHLINHFTPQTTILGGLAHVEQYLDRFAFVLKFENLAAHWQLLHDQYQLPAPALPVLHAADHQRPYPPGLTRCPPNYRELSPEVRAYMQQVYQADYQLLDLFRRRFPHL